MAAKHRVIFERLQAAILDGRYGEGERLPSEAELVSEYRVSRPTAGRALRELERLGLVVRRVGSGTFARRPAASGSLFGLIIPRLGEIEIFEPICTQIAREVQRHGHFLLWGDSTEGSGRPPGAQAEALCRQYVERKVAGVFFAPLELTPEMDVVNRRILERLSDARIPVVLLDRDIVRPPDRSPYDLVMIHHSRAAYLLTRHLLGLGCRRIHFLSRPLSAPTIEMRRSGYREALFDAGITPRESWVHVHDPEDQDYVRRIVERDKAEAIIGVNDVTAAQLLHSLDSAGYRVPRDVRVVGFDDVKYATLLRVPLTTIHQPTEALGTVAVQTLLERSRNRTLPPRDILLQATLVVRKSCGAK